MSKQSIRWLNLPLHDSSASNLETMVMGGKTLKKLWITWGHNPLGMVVAD